MIYRALSIISCIGIAVLIAMQYRLHKELTKPINVTVSDPETSAARAVVEIKREEKARMRPQPKRNPVTGR